MAKPFAVRVAGFTVRIDPRHEAVRALCADYLIGEDGYREAEEQDVCAAALRAGRAIGGAACVCKGEAVSCACADDPDLTIVVDDAALERERALATEERAWSEGYLETLAVLRAIAEWAPEHGALLLHGALVAYAGRAYLFAARSGTGKSTHVALWRRALGDALTVINGDKPLVRFADAEGGSPIAYGTPWAGKEGWQRNASAPLAGICFLERAEPGCSRARRIDAAVALDRLMTQVYLPEGAAAMAATLEGADALLRTVPLYEAACDISLDAVKATFEALVGAPLALPGRDVPGAGGARF